MWAGRPAKGEVARATAAWTGVQAGAADVSPLSGGGSFFMKMEKRPELSGLGPLARERERG